MQTQVLGLSVDSVPCLKAWAESLGGISYPLVSDFYPHGAVAQQYGLLRSEGYTERAIVVIDKAGILRNVNVHDIGKQPDNDELFRILAEVDPQAASAYAASQPEAFPDPEPDSDVVMYCTSWCPDCPRARAYLKKHNITYVEVDIGRDRAAAARVRAWADGNETTPTFKVRGQVIVDFDRRKLDDALGLKS